MDLVGRKLGKYEVVERLGRGGMADVYKAFQPGVERYVAIKVMHHHLVDADDFVARFRREAQSVGRLQHPNIVRVIDFDAEAGVYYMVMDFIQGGTLHAYLREKSPLPIEEAVQITTQLADALAYAHDQNMVHRDIKPGNVMFTDAARTHPVLTDFGIAHLLDEQTQKLTMTGASVGTPSYMSPEAARGESVDARADIYSLGIMLYEMAVGRLPYTASTPLSLMMQQNSEPLPPPQSFNPNVPPALAEILEKALAKDPADRYQSARALGDALRNLSNASGAATQPSARSAPQAARSAQKPVDPVTRRRNLGLALAGVGVLLIAVVTALLLTTFGNDDSGSVQPVAVASATPTPAGAEEAAIAPTEPPTATAIANTATPETAAAENPAPAPDAAEAITPTLSAAPALSETQSEPAAAPVVTATELISATDAISAPVSVNAPLTNSAAISETQAAPAVAAAITDTAAITAAAPISITESLTDAETIDEPAPVDVTALAAAPRTVGQLRFAPDADGSAAQFQLRLETLPAVPPGSQYALWLLGNADAALHLASFDAAGEFVTATGVVSPTQLLAHQTALVGIEPVAEAGQRPPATAIFSGTLPAPLLTPLRTLLAANANGEPGLLAVTRGQIVLVIDHGGFMQDALNADDLNEARRHMEHIVHILDGESGQFFNDLNGDGQIQNPGNGIGIGVHLQEIGGQLDGLPAPLADDISAQLARQSITQMSASATAARDKTLQMIAADSVAEVQPRANELNGMLAALAAGADANGDGVVDPVQGEGGLDALETFVLRLLEYRFLDRPASAADALGAASTAQSRDVLHFYKSAAAASAEEAAEASGVDSQADGAPIYADAFRLSVDGLSAPPAAHHYELWLASSADDAPLALGALTVQMGRAELDGSVEQELLTAYNQAQIVMVADDSGAADGAAQIVLQTERPAALDDFLRLALVQGPETDLGAAQGAVSQLALAVLHTGFLQDELNLASLDGARRHAEHVINILVGEGGQFYGDLDNDGLPQNPGDDVGVLVYLAQTEALLNEIAANADLPADVRILAARGLEIIENSRTLIDESIPETLRVFAADTVEEVQVFEDEIRGLLRAALNGVEGTEGINTLIDLMVQMGGYEFME